MRELLGLAFLLLALPLAAERGFDLDALDSYVPALMRKRSTAGLQLCLESRGQILCKSYGVLNREGAPVTDETLFLAAGLLKPFSAQAAKKKLGYEKKIESAGGVFTVRELVSESAGLLPSHYAALPGRSLPAVTFRREFRRGLPLASAANWALLQNADPGLLDAAVLELKKAGLNAAVDGGEITAGRAVRSMPMAVAGYRLFETPLHQTAVPLMDGLWISASDYRRALAQLPADSLEVLARNPDSQAGGGAGAGLDLLVDPCAGGLFARVQGERGAFSSLAAVKPGEFSIVLFSNSGPPHSLRELFHFVRKWVLPGTCAYYAANPPSGGPAAGESGLAGDYRPLDPANPGILSSFFQDLRISESEDGLEMSGMFDAASSALLVPRPDGTFLVRGGAAMDGWTIEPVRDDGRVTGFVTERGTFRRVPVLFSMRGFPVLFAIVLFGALGVLVLTLNRKRRNI